MLNDLTWLDLFDSGTSIRFLRSYNGWANGFLCWWIPESWRKHGDVGKRQQKQTGFANFRFNAQLNSICMIGLCIFKLLICMIKAFLNTDLKKILFHFHQDLRRFKFIHFCQMIVHHFILLIKVLQYELVRNVLNFTFCVNTELPVNVTLVSLDGE